MAGEEAQIQHEILTAWGAHPHLRIARVNTGAAVIRGRLVRFGVPGTADICGVAAPTGRLIMIEVKALKGKQRDAQAVMQRVVTQMGGVYIVARSLADVDRSFAELGITR
jgi:hypothetical protein